MKKTLLLAIVFLTGCGEPDFSCSNEEALAMIKQSAYNVGKSSLGVRQIINEDYLEALDKLTFSIDNISISSIDPLTKRHWCNATMMIEKYSINFDYQTYPLNAGEKIGVEVNPLDFRPVINKVVYYKAKLRHSSDITSTRESLKRHYEQLDKEEKLKNDIRKSYEDSFKKHNELFKSDQFKNEVLPAKIERFIADKFFNGKIEIGSHKIIDFYLDSIILDKNGYYRLINGEMTEAEIERYKAEQEQFGDETKVAEKKQEIINFLKIPYNTLREDPFDDDENKEGPIIINFREFIYTLVDGSKSASSPLRNNEEEFFCGKKPDHSAPDLEIEPYKACIKAYSENNPWEGLVGANGFLAKKSTFEKIFMEVLAKNKLLGNE